MRIEPLRPNVIPAQLTMALMGLTILTNLVFIAYVYRVYVMLENYAYDGIEDAFEFKSGAESLSILVQLGLSVTFLLWFSRAYHNLQRLGTSLDYEVGWTVGGWIVPILSLYRPWQIYREIARKYSIVAQAFPHHLQADTPTRAQLLSLGGWWWSTWLASGFLSIIPVLMIAYDPEGGFSVMELAQPIFMIVPGVLMIFVVHRTSKMEAAIHRIWSSGDFQAYLEEREMAKAHKAAGADGEKTAEWFQTEAENADQLNRNEDPFQ